MNKKFAIIFLLLFVFVPSKAVVYSQEAVDFGNVLTQRPDPTITKVASLVNKDKKTQEDIQELKSYLAYDNTMIQGLAGLGLVEAGYPEGLRTVFYNDYTRFSGLDIEHETAVRSVSNNAHDLWGRTDRAVRKLGERAGPILLELFKNENDWRFREHILNYLLDLGKNKEMITISLNQLLAVDKDPVYTSPFRCLDTLINGLSGKLVVTDELLPFLLDSLIPLLGQSSNENFFRGAKLILHMYDKKLEELIPKLLSENQSEEMRVGLIQICTLINKPWGTNAPAYLHSDSNRIKAAAVAYLRVIRDENEEIVKSRSMARYLDAKLFDMVKNENSKNLSRPYTVLLFYDNRDILFQIRTVGEAAFFALKPEHRWEYFRECYLDDQSLSDDEIIKLEEFIAKYFGRHTAELQEAQRDFADKTLRGSKLTGEFLYISPFRKGIFEPKEGEELFVDFGYPASIGEERFNNLKENYLGRVITVEGDLREGRDGQYIASLKDSEGRIDPGEIKLQELARKKTHEFFLKNFSDKKEDQTKIPVFISFISEETAKSYLKENPLLARYQNLIIETYEFPSAEVPFWVFKVTRQKNGTPRLMDFFFMDAQTGRYVTRALERYFELDGEP